MDQNELKQLLEQKAAFYNCAAFIENDPISVPHRYTRKEDIEIAGFLSATIAWGNRLSIVRNGHKLMQMMDDRPYEFVTTAGGDDLKPFGNFVHRTFNPGDTLFFIEALRNLYLHHGGLEAAFTRGLSARDTNILPAIMHFRRLFLGTPHLQRSEKHLANPEKGSTAKRINMFLRWMVRRDASGVDFGLWKGISPAQLCCPLDIHSGRVARSWGLLTRKQNDWKAVVELTEVLKVFDPGDPVKYDFALFGSGVNE